jgi:tetratricopeptide (TPR) repeat protein
VQSSSSRLPGVDPHVWVISATVLGALAAILTVLAARGAAGRNSRRRDAPGVGLGGWRFGLFIASCACLCGGMILLTENALNRPKQSFTVLSIAGWFLMGISFVPRLLIATVRTSGWRWIYNSLLLGDYDQALARADKLLRWFPDLSMLHYMRGVTLLYAGKPAEAEQSVRESLSRGHAGVDALRAIRLTTLGETLLARGRFKEATELFEQSSTIDPQYAGGYSGLAMACLLQDGDPQRALQLADRALELKQSSATQNLDRHTLANMWAARAEALAMLGRNTEASSSLETVAQAGDPAFIPGTAATLWRCGRALRRMGRENAAIDQFKRAVELDPRGLSGALAASALREHSIRVSG